MSTYTLALDAMGGDLGPQSSLEAALSCLGSFPRLKLLWFGAENQLANLLKCVPQGQQHLLSRITIVDAPEVVEMSDDVSVALRQKQNSSMCLALRALTTDAADVCVSSGNSAALMAFSRQSLATITGFDRPAFASHVPTANNPCLIVDMGANLSPNAGQLVQYAAAGHRLESALTSAQTVPVGLLNIAAESGKGQPEVQLAHALLQQRNDIDYVGYIEPQDVFLGKVSVLVCDGYAGNVMIKSAEGVSQLLNGAMSDLISKHDQGQVLQDAIQKPLQARFNPKLLNGAFLLGLQRLVVKSHSYADAEALLAAMTSAVQYLEMEVTQRLVEGNLC